MVQKFIEGLKLMLLERASQNFENHPFCETEFMRSNGFNQKLNLLFVERVIHEFSTNLLPQPASTKFNNLNQKIETTAC
jgi:hypothetical protein